MHLCTSGNWQRWSRSLPDLTGQFTPRADDRHALPLGSLGKIFSLAFILPSLPVMFPTLNSIKPQHPPLVCSPANCFKFQSCDRTPQAADLTLSLRYCKRSRHLQHQSLHNLLLGLLGYLIRFVLLAFAPHCRMRSGKAPSPPLVLIGLQDLTPSP